jgi:hypothetical protein
MVSTTQSLASALQDVVGKDYSRELKRLEPIKGRMGNRFVEKVKDELNRLVTFFKTWRLSTSDQVCILMDREVKKLSKALHECEESVDAHKTPLEDEIRMRKAVEKLAKPMAEIMGKIYEKGGKKHSTEIKQFNNDINRRGLPSQKVEARSS